MFKAITILAISVLAAAAAWGQAAQRNAKAVHLKDGTTVQFNADAVDSTRLIFTPAGDSLAIKVYETGKESRDFLYSQIRYVEFHEQAASRNANANNAGDLAKNKEAWRLEFPRLYQGSNVTFEVTHSTAAYGITYSLEWDGTLRANRWTCYEMHDGNSARNVSRQNGFAEDTAIPSQYRSRQSDYSGSGFSRGHLCPSGDRLCSAEQNQQTFLLSNMQPQYQNHNGVLWNKMEEQVRAWNNSSYRDTLYVVKAGTIAPGQYSKVSSTQLPIPKYFYMAVLAVKNGAYHAIGFWTEHKDVADNNKNLGDYAVSIDELERLTGIDFFCNLPDDVEAQVESSLDLGYWRITTSR